MKQKIYLIDATAEKGHVLFLKRLIQILEKEYEIEFISSTGFANAVERESSIKFRERWFERPSRIHFVIYQILILLKVAWHLDKKVPMVFTGFENISFSLCSRIFRSNRVFAYLHNNLDKTGISNFFLRNTSNKVCFIAMEEYIKEYFIDIVKNEVAFTPHPLNLDPKTPTVDGGYIFAININLSDSQVREQIKKIANERKSKIFVKLHPDSDFETKMKGVVVEKYFSDYLEKIRNASLIILQIPYDYRVSGVFYECSTLNKPILFIGQKGQFAEKMIQEYPFAGDNISVIDKRRLGSNFDFYKRSSDSKILKLWQQIL